MSLKLGEASSWAARRHEELNERTVFLDPCVPDHVTRGNALGASGWIGLAADDSVFIDWDIDRLLWCWLMAEHDVPAGATVTVSLLLQEGAGAPCKNVVLLTPDPDSEAESLKYRVNSPSMHEFTLGFCAEGAQAAGLIPGQPFHVVLSVVSIVPEVQVES